MQADQVIEVAPERESRIAPGRHARQIAKVLRRRKESQLEVPRDFQFGEHPFAAHPPREEPLAGLFALRDRREPPREQRGRVHRGGGPFPGSVIPRRLVDEPQPPLGAEGPRLTQFSGCAAARFAALFLQAVEQHPHTVVEPSVEAEPQAGHGGEAPEEGFDPHQRIGRP